MQGEIVNVDDDALIALIKRAPDAPHPRALIPGDPIKERAEKCVAAARRGRARRQRAVTLLRGVGDPAPGPSSHRGPARRARVQAKRPGAEAIDPRDVADLARRLDGSALVVQGPPGTGKTFTGAHVVAALLAEGKRVGVTSTSHKAIHNLLDAIEDVVAERGEAFRGVKKCDGANDETKFVSTRPPGCIENSATNAAFGEYALVAGTAWLFSRDDVEPVDYLFIDEAGQVSLADALAMATNARNVILLGDPLQLAHVSRGTHPEGARVSVLEHLLAEPGAAGPCDTIPEDRGIFLDRTFRMHPALCEFVSTMVYEGRLCAAASCARQRIDALWFTGAGLRYVPVVHEANAQSSEEEAAAVEEILAGLIGGTFTDRFGAERDDRKRRARRVAVQRAGAVTGPPPAAALRRRHPGRHRRQVPGAGSTRGRSTRSPRRAPTTHRAAPTSCSRRTASTWRCRAGVLWRCWSARRNCSGRARQRRATARRRGLLRLRRRGVHFLTILLVDFGQGRC